MRHQRRRFGGVQLLGILLGGGLLTCGGFGCGNAGSSPNEGSGDTSSHPTAYPYRIVTTCAMVTDIVQIVAGDKAKVIGLMGEGVDPHLYKPTRNDVKHLMDADVVFYSGLMLEGRMGDTFAKVARKGKPVYAVTEGLDEKFLRQPPEFAGHWDPHVWMDVAAWSEAVAFTAKALAEFDPPNAETYAKNAETYRAELTKLDEYAKKSIASIPAEQRVLITAHDAFGYFGRAYKIDINAVQGLSTESEASLKDLQDLIDFIVKRKVNAIFVETSVNPKSIQKIIEDARQRNWQLTIGGELFSDAMGKAGTYEGTYIGMIDHNATVITRALGGKAPENGLNGKLAGSE